MNNRRAKWIRNLVIDEDPSLLLTVRQYVGDKTKDLDDYKLYKLAKKLWKKKIPEAKFWGKWITKGESK